MHCDNTVNADDKRTTVAETMYNLSAHRAFTLKAYTLSKLDDFLLSSTVIGHIS